MTRVFLAFGSNVGERIKNIIDAIIFLRSEGVIPLKLSSIYETPPYGYENQPMFVNAVGVFEFSGSPEELLEITSKVEIALGRRRDVRWGPRSIDIDILLFDSVLRNTRRLSIPHYDMKNRDFVLVPLLEIDPGITEPATGIAYVSYIEKLENENELKKVMDSKKMMEILEVPDATQKK